MVRHLVVALVGVAAACARPAAPVPLLGSATDLAALAGEWSGEYSSEQTGRRGSVVFRLSAGTDSATGDVVMSPTGFGRQPGGDPSAASPIPPAAPQVLTISFVRVEEGKVSGRLAPYTDPRCGCTLFTVFEGRLSGNTLEGTYTSRHSATGEVEGGRWKVTRAIP